MEVGITGHNFGRGSSKDHSSKVWSKLAQWFLRRRLKCEKFTTDNDDDDGRRTKHDGKSSHGLWPGELKTINKRSTYVRTLSNVGMSICATTSSNVGMSICATSLPIRDVAQIDIPTLLDLWGSFIDSF